MKLGQAFYLTAEQLAKTNSEASLRSSVSRAYYGVFHEARELIVDEVGVVFGKTTTSVHTQLPRCLMQSQDRFLVAAGRALDDLRDTRNEADYDASSKNFKSTKFIEFQLAKAKKAIENISSCDREAIREIIRNYASNILKLTLSN